MPFCPAHAQSPRLSRGFTLIELLVTITVIAILAGIALPSYTSHVRKSRRAVAAGCLQELAQHMERRYTVNMSYLTAPAGSSTPESLPNSTCRVDLQAYYTFAFDSPPTASIFTVQATPVGPQTTDSCGTLTLNHQGTRTPAVNCWP